MTDFNVTNRMTNENVHGFKYLLKLAFRLRYWILAAVLILVAAVFISLRFVEKQYVRTCKVVFDHRAFVYVIENRDTIDGYRSFMAANCREISSAEMTSTPFLQYFVDSSSLSLSLAEIQSHLSVDYDKTSNIFNLNYKTANPQQADSILLELVEVYNAYTLRNQLLVVNKYLQSIENASRVVEMKDSSLWAEDEVLTSLAQCCQEEQANQLLKSELLQRKVDVGLFLTDMKPALTVVEAPSGSDTPVSPHAKFLYLLAVCLGIFVPLIVAEFVDYMKR